MRNLKFIVCPFLLVVLIGISSVIADNDVKVFGQVRFRGELDKRNVVFDENIIAQGTGYLRTRLGIKVTIQENATALIQFQDSRILGGFSSGGDATSATLNDGRNVDVHQAYIKVKNFFGEGWGLQAGRFEVNLGNERLFGAVGWHNVGRSMEGGILSYENPNLKVMLWDIKAVEAQNPLENEDFDIIGVNLDLKQQNISVWGSLDYLAEKGDLDDGFGVASGDVESMLKRFSIGGYLKRTEGQVDYEANVVYQTGTQLAGTVPSLFVQQDIAAFLFAAEIGYTLEGQSKPRVAIGVDFASGDDDLSDTDYKAFNNLYYTGHKFRGYMDYFLASSPLGLLDFMLRGKFNPTDGWTVKADVHLFKFAQPYTDFKSEETKDAGMELDASAATSRIAGVKLVNGFSIFFPSESFAARDNPDTGLWGYSMLIMNF